MFERLLHSTPAAAPYLIAGLGNPGREYRDNRHNVGFMLVDRLCEALGVKIGKVQSKALIGSGQYSGQKVILAKPQTFMNLSGQAVAGLARFYKVPLNQILVACDDLDLPLGTLRLRPSGGSAGQKGLGSIIEQLGSNDIPRMRIGIGRPPGQMDAAAYVLQNFSGQDQEILAITLDKGVKAAQTFIEKGLEMAMNQFNGGIKEG